MVSTGAMQASVLLAGLWACAAAHKDGACPAGLQGESCLGGAAPEQLLIQTKATSASVHRHKHSALQSKECHTAVPGEHCYVAVDWAMKHGIYGHPHWYGSLTKDSSFEDFQAFLHRQGTHRCDEPCGESGDDAEAASSCCAVADKWKDVRTRCSDCTHLVLTAKYGGRCDRYCESIGHVCVSAAEEKSNDCRVKYTSRCDTPILGTSDMLCKCKKPDAGAQCGKAEGPSPVEGDLGIVGGTSHAHGSSAWVSSGQVRGQGWCAADIPAHGWSLKESSCGNTEVRVLSYNLFWWNLFRRRGGNGGSAGRLIASTGSFDIMGFQECEDAGRVLRDAGLGGRYGYVNGGSALAIAWNEGAWQRIDDGRKNVAEDRRDQYYGNRAVHWVRLRHRKTGQTVFFMNHHGPLPVNTGGVCGGTATAYNVLKAMAENSQAEDAKMLVGDFNADGDASTQRTLASRLHRASHHWVDGVFGSCPGSHPEVLGKGGSDHDAIAATFRI